MVHPANVSGYTACIIAYIGWGVYLFHSKNEKFFIIYARAGMGAPVPLRIKGGGTDAAPLE